MSDASVANALRSSARLVVIEAPAGCGKTFQGARYAREVAGAVGDGRVLILAHTHAACDVFASRTRSVVGNVDVRTIDSLIAQVAGAYHLALNIPADPGAWARGRKDGYAELATKVAKLLRTSPMIARSLARRYPIVICDEHQDATDDQHAVAMAFHSEGAAIRFFGDPMQRIYGSKKEAQITADYRRWENLKTTAEAFDELDKPHRWSPDFSPLGQWILDARTALRTGGQIDLRGTLPPGVSIVVAENESPKQYGGYQLPREIRKSIHALTNGENPLLVLAANNGTVDALRTFFFRRLPIWEGHMRNSLADLLSALRTYQGDPLNVAKATVAFLNHVTTGFSPSAYSDAMLADLATGCVKKRNGKPAALQTLGRLILEQPDHRGVAKLLLRLSELAARDPSFKAVHIDYRREFWEAVQLGRFSDADEGFAEISRRRTYHRPAPPAKAISTIHKAKGLECSDVLLLPCDARHFGNTAAARCLLYVAMSRAMRSLAFVVSRKNPSPLLLL